ncbi:hypothetical protein VNO77_18668 [Canavalia gladiata]|uniref:Uncharacterized protein n=1 Tax=Canavalia gladiata TaxID=3824 RepID=A0AAN9LLC3_CANGL
MSYERAGLEMQHVVERKEGQPPLSLSMKRRWRRRRLLMGDLSSRTWRLPMLKSRKDDSVLNEDGWRLLRGSFS